MLCAAIRRRRRLGGAEAQRVEGAVSLRDRELSGIAEGRHHADVDLAAVGRRVAAAAAVDRIEHLVQVAGKRVGRIGVLVEQGERVARHVEGLQHTVHGARTHDSVFPGDLVGDMRLHAVAIRDPVGAVVGPQLLGGVAKRDAARIAFAGVYRAVTVQVVCIVGAQRVPQQRTAGIAPMFVTEAAQASRGRIDRGGRMPRRVLLSVGSDDVVGVMKSLRAGVDAADRCPPAHRGTVRPITRRGGPAA